MRTACLQSVNGSRQACVCCHVSAPKLDRIRAITIAEAENHAFSLVVAYAGSGTVHGRRGDYVTALGFLERGLVISHMSDIPLLFPLVAAPLGWVCALAGRRDEGVRLLQDAVQRAEAMEFAANHALRLTWLGEACLLAGDADTAKRHALCAMELAQRLGERGHEAYALRLLGELAMKGSVPDVEQAAEHYRAALAIDPGYKVAHNNLGVALGRQNKPAEAIEHFKRALETDPDYKDAHYNLANALADRGDTAQAIEHYRAALSIDPGYEAARNNLSVLLELQGKK